ncbi:MAG: hypothetical protein WA419_10750 [Silvibacterium sp.]
MDYRVKPGEMKEDQLTSYLESLTAQMPSSFYLGAAFFSMALSLGLKAAGKDHGALYVGQWVAPFLIIGAYNKMVKQHGSDAATRRENAI